MKFRNPFYYFYRNFLLQSIDSREAVNEENDDGATPLLSVVSSANWKLAEELLSNENLKRPSTSDPEESEGTIDVHPTGLTGLSALTQLIVAR